MPVRNRGVEPQGDQFAMPTRVREGEFDWFDRLSPNGALFAVDMTQRVTRWNASCSRLLGDADQATGRHCYEVVAGMDPRNKPLCRPNCPVITAAKRGQPLPDFEVWMPGRSSDRAAQVSILLSEGADGSVQVLHLVRESNKPPRGEAPGGNLRPMLAVLARPVDREAEAAGTLTARQREVLAGLAAGESGGEIARRLGLSANTVRNHIQAAMTCLGAHSRLEAVLGAVERGLL